jgi:hypothetical protein
VVDVKIGASLTGTFSHRQFIEKRTEYSTGVVYDHRTKDNGVTVWKVRFRNAPGGMQDFEMEEEALMEAIKLYAKQKEMDCKITAARRRR